MINQRRIFHSLVGAILACSTALAQAETFNFSGAAVANCTLSGTAYSCSSLPLDKKDSMTIASGYTVNVTSDVDFAPNQGLAMSGTARLSSGGNLDISKIKESDLQISGGSLVAALTFESGKQSITADVSATTINVANHAVINGSLTASEGVTLGPHATISGNITADTLTLDSHARIDGSATVDHALLNSSARITETIYCTAGTAENCGCVTNNSGYPVNTESGPVCAAPASAGPHHIQITHDGSALTCSPRTVTLTACANSACTGTPYSGGTNVTLSPGGQVFAIGASGINSAATVQQGTVGTATLSATSSVATASASSCVNTGGASCAMEFASSGFLLSVPDHVAESSSTVSISAVRKSDNSLLCVPAFGNVTKSVNLCYGYSDPGSGSRMVRINDIELGAKAAADAQCGAAAKAFNLDFNDSGVATAALKYADVGRVALFAELAALSMEGSTSFTATPKAFSFSFSGMSSGPFKAGALFTVNVTASNESGAVTPNFGKETAAVKPEISFTKCQPNVTGAVSGSFKVESWSSPANGTATATMTWDEVGRGDLMATLSTYLGAASSANGSTSSGGVCSGIGNVGPFIPHHFDVAVTQPGSFTYSGQPMTVTVTAKNAKGDVTVNYKADHAKKVALEARIGAALAPNALSVPTIESAAFANGAATAAPAYTFTNPLTAPTTITLRATETETDDVSSAGFTEGSALIRSGRLRMFNAFGSAKANLKIPVRAEYWTGNSWLLNGEDGFTDIAATALALSPASGLVGVSAIAIDKLDGGKGEITLNKPSAGSGSVDLAINLGSGGTDQSCLTSHPSTTGAAQPWLRSRNGGCATTYDRDPSARASFGVYAPETRKTVHMREVFN